MVPSPGHSLICITLVMAASAAAAQTTRPAGRPDPLDAMAPVPAVAYESALRRHRRSADEPPIAWREANDTAARIGGWRAYAREAQQPEAAASAAADPKPRLPPPGGRESP